MGGSLGLALRQNGLAARVIGIDHDADALRQAQELGAIDDAAELAAGVREADFIVVAAPVGVMPDLLQALAPYVRSDALLTDLGSVKGRIVEVGAKIFGPRFVGGHPMAGSEKSGVGAAKADLFAGAAWAIVRNAPFSMDADPFAARLAELARALGAIPLALDAAQHDEITALVSHLPHLLSFAFARTVAASPQAELARQMAGGSFRDIMRVSAADPALWRGIFTENRTALIAALNAWEAHLQTLRAALESPDSETSLVDVLAQAPGHLAFQTGEEVDAYLREERDAWEI